MGTSAHFGVSSFWKVENSHVNPHEGGGITFHGGGRHFVNQIKKRGSFRQKIADRSDDPSQRVHMQLDLLQALHKILQSFLLINTTFTISPTMRTKS
jgi:hypothetical protein